MPVCYLCGYCKNPQCPNCSCHDAKEKKNDIYKYLGKEKREERDRRQTDDSKNN